MKAWVHHQPKWGFVWWLLVGAMAGFGVASLLTIGAAFLALAAILAAVGLVVPALRTRAVSAIPAGVGLVVLYLGWLNRGGPGRVCTTTPTQTSCVDQWSPWPFVAGAAILFVGAYALARTLRS